MAKDSDRKYVRSFAPTPIEALAERLARSVDRKRGMRISATELDWLVVVGGYEALLKAEAEEAYLSSRARLEAAGADLKPIDALRAKLKASDKAPR